MDNNNVKTVDTEAKNNETIDFTYQGMIYTITKEEYEALRDGWLTAKEMFE